MIVKFSRTRSTSVGLSFLVSFAWALCLLSRSAIASTTEVNLTAREKVMISISDGNLNLLSSPSAKTVRLTFTDGTEGEYLVEKKDGVLELRSRDQLSKSEFAKSATPSGSSGNSAKKKREIDVVVPSWVDIEFHVLDGSVAASGFSHEVLGHLQKGRMQFKDCQGANLTLHSQKGEVLVTDSQGRIFVDSYAGSVNLKNFVGDVDLHNFSGETNLEKMKGFLSLGIGSGVAKVLSSAGSLQFELGKGSVTSHLFSGRVEGQVGEGAVSVTLASENDLNIKAQSGKITVQTPLNSGALLNISTQEGEIYGPSYLRVARDGGNKTLRGRLKGESQKSSIVIRGQETAIVIK